MVIGGGEVHAEREQSREGQADEDDHPAADGGRLRAVGLRDRAAQRLQALHTPHPARPCLPKPLHIGAKQISCVILRYVGLRSSAGILFTLHCGKWLHMEVCGTEFAYCQLAELLVPSS